VVREISDMLRHLNADGVAILLVEQNARLALGLSQRGYILEKGRVVANGPAASLLDDAVLTQYLVI
jgi:branched-chain amino acid transport system ATP-binding protein